MAAVSPDLAKLQNDVARALLGDDGAILSAIDLDTDVAEQRLAIYRNTALSGLVGALRLSYPMTEKVVGTPFFDQTALAFAREQPPADPVLARYGAGFPAFLESLPSLAALRYLPDLARLEWAIDQAGYASAIADRSITFEVEDRLATVAIASSLRLLATDTHVLPLWRALAAGDEETLAGIDWAAGPQFLAVHHGKDGPAVTPLSEPAWHLAAALLAGDDLDTAAGAADAAIELLSSPFIHIALADPDGSKRTS